MKRYLLMGLFITGMILGVGHVVCAADLEQNYSYSQVAMPEIMIGVGTRATAMGGAAVAVSNDLASLYWNPAGLEQLDTPHFSFIHNTWIQEINRESIIFAVPFGRNLTVALGANYWGLGSYEKTEVTSDDRMIYNQESVNMAMFGGTLGMGIALSPDISVGVGATVAMQSLGEVSPMTVYADLGTQYHGIKNTMLGLTIENIGMGVEGYSIPMETKLGGAYEFHFGKPGDLILALDTELLFNDLADSIVHFGFEYVYAKILKIRSGYEFSGAAKPEGLWGLTVGLGVQLGAWDFGYSFAPQGDLGISHRISLALDLKDIGKPSKKKRKKKVAKKKPVMTPRMGFGISGGSMNTRQVSPRAAISKDEAAMRSFLSGNLKIDARITKAKKKGAREVHFRIKRSSGARVKSWKMTLRNREGLTLREIRGKELPRLIRWDGRDKKDRVVDDIKGVRYVFESKDVNGQKEEQQGRIGVGSGGTLPMSKKRKTKSLETKTFSPILFGRNQAEVSTKAAKQIAVAADFIHQYPNSKIYIEGYTDSVNEGSKKVYLSKARAEAVARYLTAYHKIPISRILMRGRGDTKPVANNLDPDQRYRNRRVIITVKGQKK